MQLRRSNLGTGARQPAAYRGHRPYPSIRRPSYAYYPHNAATIHALLAHRASATRQNDPNCTLQLVITDMRQLPYLTADIGRKPSAKVDHGTWP